MMGQNLRWHSRRIRNPHLDSGVGVGEPLREHANHRVWLAVEMNLPAHNRRVSTETPLEQIPRQHHGTSFGSILALRKRASEGGIYPQERKQVPASSAGAH